MSLSKESKQTARERSSGSGFIRDIATLSLQARDASQTTEGATSKDAKLFCRKCEELLCNECKTIYKKFTISGLETSTQFSVADKKVEHVGTFHAQSSDDIQLPLITSSAFLSDSTLLLVDIFNKNLKHFDSSFKLIQVKPFKDLPRRVAVNENNETVITTSGFSIIKLSVKDTIEEKGAIKVNFDCCGIDFINKDWLAVVGSKNPGIFCVYIMDGTELFRTTTDKMSVNLFLEPTYLTVDREKQRAYVSDSGNNNVVSLDLHLDPINVLFRYSFRSFAPAGIVRTGGCITICIGDRPGSIRQISEEGLYIKQWMSNTECMEYPRTISFTPRGDRFIVGGGNAEEGENIHIFCLR